jgi:acetylornithine deacetylase/succinyl-diaminopimelate desuccinylase-like protein
METLGKALEYAAAHRDHFVRVLAEMCAIPGVSTLPEHAGDVRRTAEWLAERLRGLGMETVEIFETPGHPVVHASWKGAPGRPTVLVYGHYDVQPVDPLAEWHSDPFRPEIRNDRLYARGASDMKAQTVAHLAALEAIRDAAGAWPVNLVFLLEGEEETGSENLPAFVAAHRDLLACDVILNCDGGINGVETPSINYGLRGLVYYELEVRGPAADLHSGVFGGTVHNPAQALCELVAGMHDASGKVTLPGFYDRVRPLDTEERATLALVPQTDADYLAWTGAPALWGEPEYTPLERTGARPTLEVNGIIGGFTGTGAKTVLPAKAMAKLSARIVPDQHPYDITRALRAYLGANAPNTITWELRELSRGEPAVMDRHSPYMKAAERALAEVFGKPPCFKREGGSIPVVTLLQRELGVDTVLLGFELPDAAFHGPNEHMHLPTFHRAVETYIRFTLAL